MSVNKVKQPGIYIHIPFCVKKCNYCDFLSMSASESAKSDYVEALMKEIKGYRSKYDCGPGAHRPETLYIGGGTPSCIDVSYIAAIIRCTEREFEYADNAEATIEVNPGTVTYDDLKACRDLGINRLSIGLQSADESELKALGRIHDLNDFEMTYHYAREAGFCNINIDIMTAIPGQTLCSLEHTLDIVTGMGPEHISAYSLIIEEGTPFYDIYGKEENRPFDEETERTMYHMTAKKLAERGYERYEISNFSKRGYESRHNTAYWKRRDYFGFGLGASSLINNVRYKNTSSMSEYLKRPDSSGLFEEKIKLEETDRMEEFMFLGLRMSEGVGEDDFMNEFGKSLCDVYSKEIERNIKNGLLERGDGKIRLTDMGIDYGNYVFSAFLH